MGRYYISTHMYLHEPKASENTRVRVKCHPQFCTTSVINCLLYILDTVPKQFMNCFKASLFRGNCNILLKIQSSRATHRRIGVFSIIQCSMWEIQNTCVMQKYSRKISNVIINIIYSIFIIIMWLYISLLYFKIRYISCRVSETNYTTILYMIPMIKQEDNMAWVLCST